MSLALDFDELAWTGDRSWTPFESGTRRCDTDELALTGDRIRIPFPPGARSCDTDELARTVDRIRTPSDMASGFAAFSGAGDASRPIDASRPLQSFDLVLARTGCRRLHWKAHPGVSSSHSTAVSSRRLGRFHHDWAFADFNIFIFICTRRAMNPNGSNGIRHLGGRRPVLMSLETQCHLTIFIGSLINDDKPRCSSWCHPSVASCVSFQSSLAGHPKRPDELPGPHGFDFLRGYVQ